jgi:hypothetical protein
LEHHRFLAAVAGAYADHRPLVLSPDMIWLLIAQGAAAHVNAHADELRSSFVRHEGQLDLIVRRDDFCPGSPENPWQEVFSAFAEQIARHVGPQMHGFFVPSFSTTGATERAAFEVTLLDSMRAYFSYLACPVCGIPEITLEGTSDDWREIASRSERLNDFGLNRWRRALRPILKQFVRASEGDVDVNFWRSIYHRTPPTCDFDRPRRGPEVSGWLTYFFPYLADNDGRPTVPAGWLTGRGGNDFGLSSPAGGLSIAPFQFHLRGEVRQMEFLAGFLGVAQNQATLALRPEIGWAVREAPPPRLKSE